MLRVVRSVLLGGWCVSFVVCDFSCVVCRVLLVVLCASFVVCCLSFAVCRLLCVARCTSWLLFGVCCLLRDVLFAVN